MNIIDKLDDTRLDEVYKISEEEDIAWQYSRTQGVVCPASSPAGDDALINRIGLTNAKK